MYQTVPSKVCIPGVPSMHTFYIHVYYIQLLLLPVNWLLLPAVPTLILSVVGTFFSFLEYQPSDYLLPPFSLPIIPTKLLVFDADRWHPKRG